jgi:hypothetical protein
MRPHAPGWQVGVLLVFSQLFDTGEHVVRTLLKFGDRVVHTPIASTASPALHHHPALTPFPSLPLPF